VGERASESESKVRLMVTTTTTTMVTTAKRQALDYLDLQQGSKRGGTTKKKKKTRVKGSITREFQQLLTQYRRAAPGLEKQQALVAMLQAPGATRAVAPIGAPPNKRLGQKMKRARRPTTKPTLIGDDDDDDESDEEMN
jgi:hypothetical protein